MTGYSKIEINGQQYGVLFGVHLFKIIKDRGFVLDDDPNNMMNGIYTVWAGMLNNAEFEGKEINLEFKDFYLAVNEDSTDFEKALKCFADSKIMGKPITEVAEKVKKKKKKISILGRLFQKIV